MRPHVSESNQKKNKNKNKKTTKTQTIFYLFSFNSVNSAEGLKACDANGKSDPYIIVRYNDVAHKVFFFSYFLPYSISQKSFLSTSSHIPSFLPFPFLQGNVIKDTLNPTFNETFTLQEVHDFDYLMLEVWDHDNVGSHDFMGGVIILFLFLFLFLYFFLFFLFSSPSSLSPPSSRSSSPLMIAEVALPPPIL